MKTAEQRLEELVKLFESDDTEVLTRAYDDLVADLGSRSAGLLWSMACAEFDHRHGEDG